MAAHSIVLAWRIPWTEEPGGPQSVGSQSQTRLSAHRSHRPRGIAGAAHPVALLSIAA